MSSRTSSWEGFLPKNAIVMKRKRTSASVSVRSSSVVQAEVQAAVKASVQAPLKAPAQEKPGKAESLDSVTQALQGCQLCKLSKTRTHIVVGEGSPKARLLFVGEGPGEKEDLSGRPFVGRSGQLLDKMIEALGLSRQEVYICNVVKCRPPENRNPEPDEILACDGFLKRQIRAIQPQVIVTLGKFASQTLLKTETPISELRGNFFEYEGAKMIPTYHPAYLLRNPSSKKEAWEDLQKAAKVLGLKIPKKTGAQK